MCIWIWMMIANRQYSNNINTAYCFIKVSKSHVFVYLCDYLYLCSYSAEYRQPPIRYSLNSHHHHQLQTLGFMQAGCSCCHPTNSVKALKMQAERLCLQRV